MKFPRVLRGDIVLTRNRGWLAALIRRCTRSEGEEPSQANHCSMIRDDGSLDTVRLIESTYRAREIPAREALATCEFSIYRYQPLLSETQRAIAVAIASMHVGESYPWWQLVGFWADWRLGKLVDQPNVYFLRALMGNSRVVCSGLVGQAIARARSEDDLIFGRPRIQAPDLSPDDLDDYLKASGIALTVGYVRWSDFA